MDSNKLNCLKRKVMSQNGPSNKKQKLITEGNLEEPMEWYCDMNPENYWLKKVGLQIGAEKMFQKISHVSDEDELIDFTHSLELGINNEMKGRKLGVIADVLATEFQKMSLVSGEDELMDITPCLDQAINNEMKDRKLCVIVDVLATEFQKMSLVRGEDEPMDFTPSLDIAINNEMNDRKLDVIVDVWATEFQKMSLVIGAQSSSSPNEIFKKVQIWSSQYSLQFALFVILKKLQLDTNINSISSTRHVRVCTY